MGGVSTFLLKSKAPFCNHNVTTFVFSFFLGLAVVRIRMHILLVVVFRIMYDMSFGIMSTPFESVMSIYEKRPSLFPQQHTRETDERRNY